MYKLYKLYELLEVSKRLLGSFDNNVFCFKIAEHLKIQHSRCIRMEKSNYKNV